MVVTSSFKNHQKSIQVILFYNGQFFKYLNFPAKNILILRMKISLPTLKN